MTTKTKIEKWRVCFWNQGVDNLGKSKIFLRITKISSTLKKWMQYSKQLKHKIGLNRATLWQKNDTWILQLLATLKNKRIQSEEVKPNMLATSLNLFQLIQV